MKKISNILLLFILSSCLFVSCDGLLNVDSDRNVFVEDYGLKSTNDSLYAMFGVFSQLEKLADRYVVLGELRGDLMSLTPTSNQYLKEVNDFNISSTNPYNNKKDYYSVINNCNYIIKNVDTTVVKNNEKVMYKILAAAKGIRAWTYMQLALNYKTAIYYEEPLLTLNDAEKKYPEYDIYQLADVLIKDIEPYKDYARPTLGSIYSSNLTRCFFPIRFIIGDLCLWTGQYEKAANEYRDLMFKSQYLVTSYYQSTLSTTEGNFPVFNGGIDLNWGDAFLTNSNEVITNIMASNEYGDAFMLDSLVKDHQLTASTAIMNLWDSQLYKHSVTLDTLCDLRKIQSVTANLVTSKSGFAGSLPTLLTKNYLIKFIYMNYPAAVNKKVIPYRISLLYLRYAEAVNRLGKPNLAMAVLKYGLNAKMYTNGTLPASEIPSPLPNYMNFTNDLFSNNLGIRSHGVYHPELDATYKIPTTLDSVAQINYVEDLICNECALETAFEGNRFHDLMRIAIRRGDNNYLASKVAAKHPNDPNMLTNLGSRESWYLK